jgi:hypothetical protein
VLFFCSVPDTTQDTKMIERNNVCWAADSITHVGPAWVSAMWQEVVSRVVWRGVGATARWPRTPHLFSPAMTCVELCFTNHGAEDVSNIRVSKKVTVNLRDNRYRKMFNQSVYFFFFFLPFSHTKGRLPDVNPS